MAHCFAHNHKYRNQLFMIYMHFNVFPHSMYPCMAIVHGAYSIQCTHYTCTHLAPARITNLTCLLHKLPYIRHRALMQWSWQNGDRHGKTDWLTDWQRHGQQRYGVEKKGNIIWLQMIGNFLSSLSIFHSVLPASLAPLINESDVGRSISNAVAVATADATATAAHSGTFISNCS